MSDSQTWVIIWLCFLLALIPTIGAYHYIRACADAKLHVLLKTDIK